MPTNALANTSAFIGTDAQTIYARTTNTTTNAFTVDTFSLFLSAPHPQLTGGFICVDNLGNPLSTHVLQSGLSSAQYSFTWTHSGALIPNANQSIYVATAPGTYIVTATNTLGCVGSASCFISPAAAISSVSANLNGTTLTLIANPVGDYEYSIDNGTNYQQSNIFENVIPGVYSCVVRDLQGCGQLQTVVDTTLGTLANQFKDFSYGPNPVSNNLTLSNGYRMDGVSLYNNLGQKVFDQNPQEKDYVVDCSNLHSGIYFLKVISENREQTFRIVKK